MLKSSGRGIFLMRNFMDDVSLRRIAGGRHGSAHGEEARPRRSLTASCAPSPHGSSRPTMSNTPEAAPEPSPFLATAIEAVRRAGGCSSRRVRRRIHASTRRASIDLVTEVDLAIERMFRELVAERYPDHDVLGEELGAPGIARRPAARHLLDFRSHRRHDQLRARAPDLLLVAGPRDRRRRDGRGRVRPDARRAVHGRTRPRRVAERRAPHACRRTTGWSTRCSSPGFPTPSTKTPRRSLGLFGAFISALAGRASPRLGGTRHVLRRGRADGRLLGARPRPWDIAAGALLVEEAGGRVSDLDGGPFVLRSGRLVASNGRVHDEMLDDDRAIHGRACSKADALTPSCDTRRRTLTERSHFPTLCWHSACSFT